MSYKYSEQENKVLAKSTFWMKAMGIMLMVVSIAGLLFGIIEASFFKSLGNAINLVVSGFLLHAASSFRKRGAPDGDDIGHTMTALGSLAVYFYVQAAAILFLASTFVVGILRS